MTPAGVHRAVWHRRRRPASRAADPCVPAQTGPVPQLWDLVVVGAGPAGSTAALSALRVRPGASVLLLDRADFPRDKPCGDGIAPHVLDVLSRLGVEDVVAATAR